MKPTAQPSLRLVYQVKRVPDPVFDRGGYSRFLDIRCRKCDARICVYQKDGPGNLRRMYIDRINAPMVSISNKALTCPNKHILAVKILYEKEDRPAFRLFVDAVTKKMVKYIHEN